MLYVKCMLMALQYSTSTLVYNNYEKYFLEQYKDVEIEIITNLIQIEICEFSIPSKICLLIVNVYFIVINCDSLMQIILLRC